MTDVSKLSIEQLVGRSYQCSCGRNHAVEIKDIRMGSGVINELPEVVSRFKGGKVLLAADKNTYAIAGDRVEEMLKDSFTVKKLMYKEDYLHADEKALGRMFLNTDPDTSLIVTVGSGTLNDITRFISGTMHIPYVIVCTAPSMDGYGSASSPLINDGVKISYFRGYPVAIVADVDILKEAPMHMLGAGLGDVLGKYTAMSDWIMAHLIRDEYYCENIVKLVRNVVQKCVDEAPKLPQRDPAAIRNIIEALNLAGMAMGMAGCSRPASGEEHQISHCWEMSFMDRGIKTHWLHGNQVGVGTGIILEAYKYASALDVEKLYKTRQHMNFDKEKWIALIREVYGKVADNIIEARHSDPVFDPADREATMKRIVKNWDKLKELSFSTIPSPEEVKAVMDQAGLVTHPAEVGITREFFRKSLMVSKDVRYKYGVMRLLEDVGVLEDFVEKATELYYPS